MEAVPHLPGHLTHGRLVWPGFDFTLAYTHSIYGVPVSEHFTVGWRGDLILREIRSTTPKIIEYYEIQGAQTLVRPGDVRILGLRLPHRQMTVKGTPVGGRSYADRQCRFALTALAGDWGSVDLGIRFRPLALQLWKWGGRSCPPSPKRP